jgi:hypothetical protein
MALKTHRCSYDLLAKTIELMSSSQTLHFPQPRDWSTISYLPPCTSYKRIITYETKEVVISLHHFRKQLIAHEQQMAQAESSCSPEE